MIPITDMERERERIAAICTSQRQLRAQRFAALHLPPLERALGESVSGIAQGLGGMDQALHAAVGVPGGGGHRWRPLLTLAAAQACGGDPARAMPAAVAVELTHTASLVLDDLPCMDDAPLRRGLPAAHRTVGSAGAILLAVGLLARAAELLGQRPDLAPLCAGWGAAVGLAGMSGGQAVDLARCSAGAARRRLRQKTTALSEFALSAGAQAACAGEPTRAALEGYGRALGWAYQLQDDVEDAAVDRADGKEPGGRAPRRQREVLMRRGEAALRAAPGLHPEGLELLVALGRAVVPHDPPEPKE